MNAYNIVNGDNLKGLLKDHYTNILVMREALCQGPIQDANFFENRALFISGEYKACSKEQYLDGMEEFETIKNIPANSEINLWFGQDVFCQVNFWFLINFLKDKWQTNEFYLILPCKNQNCSFGDSENAHSAYNERVLLSNKDLELFFELWQAYQTNDYESMQNIAAQLDEGFSFLQETIDAIINMDGCITETQRLSKQFDNFSELFKAFSKQYSIYGFGDLQVQYLLEK